MPSHRCQHFWLHTAIASGQKYLRNQLLNVGVDTLVIEYHCQRGRAALKFRLGVKRYAGDFCMGR